MRIVLLFAFTSMLSGCCTVRCWEKPEGFDLTMAGTSTETIARIEGHSARACSRHRPESFDESAYVTVCKNAFQDYVMGEHCGPTATRFCAEKCPTDETCRTSGEQTLARDCAEKNVEEFLRRSDFCRDFELVNATLVLKPGGKPQCR